MRQISGIYENGIITLDEKITSEKPIKVWITFIDDDIIVNKKRLAITDFSFAKSRALLKDLKSSLSDAIIEERRGSDF